MVDFFGVTGPIAAGFLAAGAVAGVLSGLLGIGGGIVIVPVLFQFLSIQGVDESVKMHIAVATSLATILPTSIRSMMLHSKRGAVDWEVLRGWALPVLVGVLIGTVCADFLTGHTLTVFFAVMAGLMALNMLFGPKDLRLGDTLPKGAGGAGLAGLVGWVSAMMGIGGGGFAILAMTLYGHPIRRAVATAAGLGALISVPATVGYIVTGWGEPGLPPGSLGYVNFAAVAFLVPATLLFAPVGVALAHRLPHKALEWVFAGFIFFSCTRMLLSLMG